MNGADARRFGFCIRCLSNPNAGDPLTEHHTSGRAAHPNQVVFICRHCHDALHAIESMDTEAYVRDNEALLAKTRMLVSSRALRFVIENRYRVASDFGVNNRNAPTLVMTPKGIEFSGSHGAVGASNARYW